VTIPVPVARAIREYGYAPPAGFRPFKRVITPSDVFSGEEVRPGFRVAAWEIGRKAASAKESVIEEDCIHCTRLVLLDGWLQKARGWYGKRAHVTTHGELVRRFILYEVGVTPPRTPSAPSHACLARQVKKDRLAKT
jgi:hypothetical protein